MRGQSISGLSRSLRWAAVLVAVVFTRASAVADDTIRALEPSSTPIHVRVLFEEDPAHEAVIAWTTTAEGKSHMLYLDTVPRRGRLAAYRTKLPSVHDAPYTLTSEEQEAGMHAFTHNVHLADLKPATRYYLTVVSDGNKSPEFHFITAPDDGRMVKLLAVGDSRTPNGGRTDENNARRRINDMIRQTFEKHPEVVALAHGGDYTGKAVWSQLYWWLKDHTEMTTTRDNRLLPIIPVRGNHDHDVGFEEMFWWPERANNYYYTTRLNANSSLITLNTEISRGGDQRNWLEAELAELRPKMRWLLVQYHRPAYPSVRSFDSAAPQREAWVPLFEKFQIDASYESHEHALKRTYPIYEGEIDATRGIIYFGDGGGGVPQRKPDADRWYLEKVGRHDYLHLLTFTDDKLDIVAIDDAGEVIDEFALTQDRRKAVNLEPAEAAP